MMKSLVTLVIAALFGLGLGTTVYARGGSGGHSGHSSHTHSSRSRPKANKKKHKKKRKKKAKNRSSRKSKSAKRRSPKKNRLAKGPKSRRGKKSSSAKRGKTRGTKSAKRGSSKKKGSTKASKGKGTKLSKGARRFQQKVGKKQFKTLKNTQRKLKGGRFKKQLTRSAARTAAAGLNKMTNGDRVSPQERDGLRDLGDTLGGEAQEAIEAGLGVDDVMAAELQGRERVWNRKYLKVINETGEMLTVFVHYRTWDQGWTWLPTTPVREKEAVRFVLKPGQVFRVWDRPEDRRVDASKVRIWARTKSGDELNENKKQDLWLVPDEEPHTYKAPKKLTYDHSFGEGDNG
jgi:hypothetical protein